MFDLSHEIDLSFWFSEGNEKESHIISSVVSELGFKAPDIAEISMLTDNGKIVGIHLDYFSQPRMRRTEITGSLGTVIIDFPDWDKYTLSSFNSNDREWKHITFSSERDDMFLAEDKAFLEAVLTDGEPQISVEEAEKSLRIISRGLEDHDRA